SRTEWPSTSGWGLRLRAAAFRFPAAFRNPGCTKATVNSWPLAQSPPFYHAGWICHLDSGEDICPPGRVGMPLLAATGSCHNGHGRLGVGAAGQRYVRRPSFRGRGRRFAGRSGDGMAMSISRWRPVGLLAGLLVLALLVTACGGGGSSGSAARSGASSGSSSQAAAVTVSMKNFRFDPAERSEEHTSELQSRE